MRGNRRGKTDGRPGESEIDRIENIEDLNPHEMTFIQYPKPPKAVSCHFGCYDCIATIWWDYNINEADGEISWEVRRYRLDVISKTYSPKGIQIYKDIVPRKYILFDLENGHHYKFTVSAINVHGKGKESKFSHSIYVDSPLPNGWFRSPSPSSDYDFLYYNLHTQASCISRPDINPYFIDDEVVVKAFTPSEVNHLTSLWNEELVHFDKMTKDRVQIILWELGHDFTSREVALLVREYSRKSSECIYDYQTFMEVMYSFKIKAQKNTQITEKIAKVGRYFLCFSKGESRPASLIERVGDWEIRRSRNTERFFSYHRGKDMKHWFMPLEARLYLSPDSTTETEAQLLYDPTELDLLRHLFCHLDIFSVGGIGAIELYRYLYVASYSPKKSSTPFLSPANILERNAIFSAIVTSTLPPPLSSYNVPFSGIRYADFLRFWVLMKRNENGEAQKFYTALPSLSTIKISKSFLLSTIEKYLVARKDKRYECPSHGGQAPVRTSPEVEVDVSNGVRRFSETEGEGGDVSLFPSWGRDHGNDEHPEWCFCGCHAGRLG